MSIWYFFSGLGKLIFSIKKAKMTKIIINNNNLIKMLTIEAPKLDCLLYLSCILYELN